MQRRFVGAFAGAMIAAALSGVAIAPTERVVLRSEQQDTKKLERKTDRLRRRLRDPLRTASKEMARRVRQIAAGRLRHENGLEG